MGFEKIETRRLGMFMISSGPSRPGVGVEKEMQATFTLTI